MESAIVVVDVYSLEKEYKDMGLRVVVCVCGCVCGLEGEIYRRGFAL